MLVLSLTVVGLAEVLIRECTRRRRNGVGVPASRRGSVDGGGGWEENKVRVRV